MRRIATLAASAALGACLSTPGRPAQSGTQDANTDARSDSGPVPATLCGAAGGSAVVFEDFDGSQTGAAACGTHDGALATISNGMVLQRSGSALHFTPGAAANGFGSCQYFPAAFTAFIAKWTMVSAPASLSYVEIHDRAANTSIADFQLVFGPELVLEDAGGTVHGMHDVAGTELWWRLRNDPAGIAGEWSTDGQSWTQLGTPITATGPNEIQIDVGQDPSDMTAMALDTLWLCR